MEFFAIEKEDKCKKCAFVAKLSRLPQEEILSTLAVIIHENVRSGVLKL